MSALAELRNAATRAGAGDDAAGRRGRWQLALVAGAAALTVGLTVGLTGCSGTGSQPGGTSSGSSAGASTGSATGSATGSGNASAAAASAPAGAQQLQNAFEQIIKQVLPSVVEIRTSSGLGSGVVFDDKGDIVTNAHVVGDATSFQVALSGRSQPVAAKLVGSYPPDDLAVIRLTDSGSTKPATFAAAGAVKAGDLVLAMGNPLGLSSSVTNGIVSAVGRTITEPAEGDSAGATIPDALQTSASINPGNSGGALVNLSGQVIGIPTLAALSPQGSGQAPGIGFAVSADLVRRIAPQLIKDGKVTDSGRAALGVSVSTVVDESGQPAGVGVAEVVKAGPAASAGIAAGDVILQVAGQPVSSSEDLAGVLAAQKVGAQVPVQFQRGDDKRTVTVTLGTLP